MRLALVSGALVIAMVGAASALTLEEAVDRTVGQHSTAAQAAAGKGKLRHVFVTSVNMPNVGPLTLYLEWRDPDANGPVTSQRVWSFERSGDALVMKYFTLNAAADKVLRGVHKQGDGDAAAVAALTLADLHGYPENCHFAMAIDGAVLTGETPASCVIYNRAEQTNMRPQVKLRFHPLGFVEDGTFTYESTGKSEHIVQEFVRIP